MDPEVCKPASMLTVGPSSDVPFLRPIPFPVNQILGTVLYSLSVQVYPESKTVGGEPDSRMRPMCVASKEPAVILLVGFV